MIGSAIFCPGCHESMLMKQEGWDNVSDIPNYNHGTWSISGHRYSGYHARYECKCGSVFYYRGKETKDV